MISHSSGKLNEPVFCRVVRLCKYLGYDIAKLSRWRRYFISGRDISISFYRPAIPARVDRW